MDDPRHTAQAQSYLCPGESHPIDRATHLGRLASFYPACRACDFRCEAIELGVRVVGQWGEVASRALASPSFSDHALTNLALREFAAPLARRFAAAFVGSLKASGHVPQSPRVLVGSADGLQLAEAYAMVCEALQWAGCHVVEVGSASAPAVAMAVTPLQAHAAILLCFDARETQTLAIQMWGPAGRPWTSPGGLDAARAAFDGAYARPCRGGGSVGRDSIDTAYLASLQPQFHALRPLRFVLSTDCAALRDFLRRLTASSACTVVDSTASSASHAMTWAQSPTRSYDRLVRQVVAERADFGFWVDGAGEACRLVSERGEPVDGQLLCDLLARQVQEMSHAARMVLPKARTAKPGAADRQTGEESRQLACRGEALFAAMVAEHAVFGWDGDERYWIANPLPAPDALLTLSLLLAILSQSDRPLSQVLASVSARPGVALRPAGQSAWAGSRGPDGAD